MQVFDIVVEVDYPMNADLLPFFASKLNIDEKSERGNSLKSN